MRKSHFDPYFNEEDGAPDKTLCGIEPGEWYISSGDWRDVTCKRCLVQQHKINDTVSSIEKDIVDQMGAFVEFQENSNESKTLKVQESDIDGYGDWLLGDRAGEFVSGGYEYIQVEGDDCIVDCTLIGYNQHGTPLVMIGEQQENSNV